MSNNIIFSSLFFILFWVIDDSFGAVVNVDGYVAPENRQTNSLKVSLNETVQGSNVTVVCEVVTSPRGSSQIVFSNGTAIVGQNETTINYRIISPGQPVAVQCSGQSQGNNKQFTLATSKGKMGSVQVTKAPIVTICDNPVVVTSSTDCLTVQVELSEIVTGRFPVVVNCSIVNNNDGPQFQFEATIISTGQKSAKVPFTTVSKGKASQSVQVVCQAQTYKVTMLPSWYICGAPVTPTTKTPTTKPPSGVSNVTTAIPITVPTASLPAVINITRFKTSTQGVDYFQYLMENSKGSPVTFMFSPIAMQFHPSSTTLRSGYSFILSLNAPQTVPLDVECSLTVLPTGPINTSAVYCPPEPIGSVMLTSSSVQLKLVQTELQFKKSEVSKTISISINGIPSSKLTDLVQLSCCAKSTGILKPASVVAFMFVDLHQYQPINSDSGSTSTSPLDIDLTCPCNLNMGQCDTGCCCDKDCLSSEKSLFACTKGFFGGDSSERPFEFSCQATWPDAGDLHPVLCVFTSTSPFIGYWYNYTTPRSATDVPSYKTLRSVATKTSYSYQFASQSQTSSPGTYKLGTSIKTAANSNDNKYLSATLGTLTLPNKVFNGFCSQTVPVRFLENTESTCTTETVESLCTSTSSLSASSYLMPKDIRSPPCPVPSAVLSKGTLSQNQNEQPELADVEVQYFCTEGSSLSSSPWRCAFDDGKTAPPLPVLNQTSKTCSNVVLNVTYRFDVSGQQVNKVTVMVTLGVVKVQTLTYSNIATSDSNVNILMQYFKTTFVRVSNKSSVSGSNVVNRSGNPGYIRGLPVLALARSAQNSTLTNLPVRSPSGNVLCTSSSSSPILYGEMSSTGCALKLTMDDLKNCSRIRELVIANQEVSLKATHVGRTGNALTTVDEDWLPIIRETIKEPLSNTIVGVCRDIPYGLVFEFLVSEAGRYKGVPQMEIVGLKVSYKYATWQFQCVSGYGLSCLAPTSNATQNNNAVTPTAASNMTATVSVNASARNSSGGSNSSSPNRGDDGNYSSPREMTFLLETSVVFIQVSSTPSARVKRSTDQSGICYQDVCKEELFYPLSPAYRGESNENVMKYFLALVFVALFSFAFTRPWG